MDKLNSLQAVLFDLDGTLTDPAEGITRCLAHALESLGAPCPPCSELARYIGPPLRTTFATLLAEEPGQSANAERVEQGVTAYRQRFAEVGLFENTVYPGIPEMLDSLRTRGLRLFVVTSKPRVYAERILVHFGLDTFFAGVYGTELDGRFDDKGELLQHMLATERIAPGAAVMVGDRQHDIEAARRNDVPSIGVTYGYGTPEELRTAGADFLGSTPQEIVATLIRA